jgi:uncharacterized protein DUF6297
MTVAPVDVRTVRAWIRKAQAAHKERGETLGNFYFALLFVLVVGGMLYHQIRAVVWPLEPNASEPAGAALILVLTGVLFIALRRLGPLALSRPAASWLLTAPVDRRRLLAPSMRLAAIGAAIAGALAGVAIVGHTGPRPLPGLADVLLPITGGLAGVGILLVALAAQAGRWWGTLLDNVAYLLLAAGLAGLVVDSAVSAPRATGGWPADQVLLGAVAALALVVGVFFASAVRRLARTPNERILDASKTAGTLADSAFGVEPSFVTEMVERRYWARRRLRSSRLWSRLPVLVAQDLLLVRRRPRRLLWLAGATALPALLSHAPAWLLGLAVLAGAFLAAGTSTATVRTDAGNPVLLRMLGLSSRQAVWQRLLVPGVLAGLWATAALALLSVLGALPAGPWWVLGLALGPVGAVGAVRRARVGFVDNSLLPIDTPMGSISTGPVLAAIIGFDVLVLGLPAVIAVALHDPLSWPTVLVQVLFGALGTRLYLTLTTSPDRVELSEQR